VIGIDIENVNNLPKYWLQDEIRFYEDNYSKEEIEFALKQSKPDDIFTILFAIKESIVKADNQFLNVQYKHIIINDMGKMFCFKDFKISYSLEGGLVIACAIKSGREGIY